MQGEMLVTTHLRVPQRTASMCVVRGLLCSIFLLSFRSTT